MRRHALLLLVCGFATACSSAGTPTGGAGSTSAGTCGASSGSAGTGGASAAPARLEASDLHYLGASRVPNTDGDLPLVHVFQVGG